MYKGIVTQDKGVGRDVDTPKLLTTGSSVVGDSVTGDSLCYLSLYPFVGGSLPFARRVPVCRILPTTLRYYGRWVER